MKNLWLLFFLLNFGFAQSSTNNIEAIAKASGLKIKKVVKEEDVIVVMLRNQKEPSINIDSYQDYFSVSWINYLDDKKYEAINIENNKIAKAMIAKAIGSTEAYDLAIECKPTKKQQFNSITISTNGTCSSTSAHYVIRIYSPPEMTLKPTEIRK